MSNLDALTPTWSARTHSQLSRNEEDYELRTIRLNEAPVTNNSIHDTTSFAELREKIKRDETKKEASLSRAFSILN
jgi:hypothetical protein